MPTKVRQQKIKIFKVEIGGEIKLVRAYTMAKAIKFAEKPKDIICAIPTPDELVDLIKQDIEVEDSIEG